MLQRVASYDRVVDASLERAWENVRDWEHLPHLHKSSFRSIELIEQSSAGWRARIGLPPGEEIVLELVIDGDRYVSRTLEGPGAGSEIWTTLSAGAGGQQTAVHVDFDIAGLDDTDEGGLAAIGRLYRSLYTQLWDEDEAMMRERATRLRHHAPPPSGRVALGPRASLSLPVDVEFEGRRVRVDELDGELIAHSLVCPHWLGPLESTDEPGVLRCPWHGYAFDRATGRSCDGRGLRLQAPPRVVTDPNHGEVAVVWD